MSWQAIVEKHGEAIFRVAYRLLHSVHDAEDVSQEVLLEAYRMPQLPNASLLKRMAAFRAIDRLRVRATTDPLDEQACSVSNPSPDESIEGTEQASLLRDAISRLPRQQSRCFWLRHVEGLTNQDIARTMSISPSAVSTALSKAKVSLRQYILNQQEESHAPR